MNILFVCTGNTCRSPMAEGYLESLHLENVSVKSRGICSGGDSVSENSALAMKQIGIDISEHISIQLELYDTAWADKIICMSESHKTALSLYTSPDKLFVLGGGIPDPFGNDLEAYKKCRDLIVSAINALCEQDFFSEMQISLAGADHFSQIAELEKICFSHPWSENTLLEAYNSGTKFYVATKNRHLLGYIGINCVLDEGYITNIAVFPNERKKGVATALLERSFSLASDLKLSFISLEVRVSNSNAISLYQKLGFKQEGLRKNFYVSPCEDALIMTKRF